MLILKIMNKNMKKNKTKGFTLIELMVVISIIALLSGIILAGVSQARESAKVRAFRSEVDQFINALELYRIEKGVYPGTEVLSGANYTTTIYGASLAEYVEDLSTFDLESMMKKYIKKIPQPTDKDASMTYLTVPEFNGLCGGYIGKFNYGIVIYLGPEQKQKGFEDWSRITSPDLYGPEYRCFVLK